MDRRQTRLLELVLGQIVHYYRDLYRTRPCYAHPLSLARLIRLCRQNGPAVTLALRYLANTVPVGSQEPPRVYYDRIASHRNRTHRPYRIFLRQSM